MDEIDKALEKALKELPDGGCILDENKKIKLDNLLLL